MYAQMTFGKHKGKSIDDVPEDYLRWVLGNVDDLNPYLHAAIVEHLEAIRRQRGAPPTMDAARTAEVVLSVVKAVRRELASRWHPDHSGGSHEAMIALNSMVDELTDRIPERLRQLART